MLHQLETKHPDVHAVSIEPRSAAGNTVEEGWNSIQMLVQMAVLEKCMFRVQYLCHWSIIRRRTVCSQLSNPPVIIFGAVSSTAPFKIAYRLYSRGESIQS